MDIVNFVSIYNYFYRSYSYTFLNLLLKFSTLNCNHVHHLIVVRKKYSFWIQSCTETNSSLNFTELVQDQRIWRTTVLIKATTALTVWCTQLFQENLLQSSVKFQLETIRHVSFGYSRMLKSNWNLFSISCAVINMR